MKRELAKCEGFDVRIEDHGILTLEGTFDMDGSGIGLGYAVDAAFIKRFLEAIGVDAVRKIDGRSCWITLAGEWNGPVVKIEPLHKSDGKAFDIAAWSEALKGKK